MTENLSERFRMPESVPPNPDLASRLQELAQSTNRPMRGAGLLLEKDGSTRILTALSDEGFPENCRNASGRNLMGHLLSES